MSKTIKWKIYYTLQESSDIIDNNIEKSADLLISELKSRKNTRKIKDNHLMHV
jgi:hypothetical protein